MMVYGTQDVRNKSFRISPMKPPWIQYEEKDLETKRQPRKKYLFTIIKCIIEEATICSFFFVVWRYCYNR